MKPVEKMTLFDICKYLSGCEIALAERKREAMGASVDVEELTSAEANLGAARASIQQHIRADVEREEALSK